MKMIFFDTETTGLKNSDVVIQFSAVIVEDSVITEMINEYCYTNKRINPEATAVHGISNSNLKELSNGQTLGDVMRKYNLYEGNKVWIAHNSKFDKKMVNNTLLNNGDDLIDFGLEVNSPIMMNSRNNFNYCTMKNLSKLVNNYKRYAKLIDLVKTVGSVNNFSIEDIKEYFEYQCKRLKVSNSRTMTHDALFDSFLVYTAYHFGVLANEC